MRAIRKGDDILHGKNALVKIYNRIWVRGFKIAMYERSSRLTPAPSCEGRPEDGGGSGGFSSYGQLLHHSSGEFAPDVSDGTAAGATDVD